MVNKGKQVLRHYTLHNHYPKILPAKKYVPDWYKEAIKYSEKSIKRLPQDLGFKSCQVFSDTFTTGYMMVTPVDIAVEQTEMGPSVSWSSSVETYVGLREHLEENKTLPTPSGCHSNHFVWLIKSGFKLPKGYSALLCAPLNRHDIPFVTLSGILDGDFTLHPGNIPVFFKEGFEGVIPAGTPFLQVIPFKQDSWTSKYDPALLDEVSFNSFNSLNVRSWYKRFKWNKKYYE